MLHSADRLGVVVPAAAESLETAKRRQTDLRSQTLTDRRCRRSRVTESAEDAADRGWGSGKSRLPFQIRRFAGRLGSEVVMLIDGEVGPAFYPNVFNTCCYVKTGRSPNTQERVLRCLGMARAWAISRGRDLDCDIRGPFPSQSDVESLADWLCLSTNDQADTLERAKSSKRTSHKVLMLEKLRPNPRDLQKRVTQGASADDAAARIRWVAEYLAWHLQHRLGTTDRDGTDQKGVGVFGPGVINRLRERARGMGGSTSDDETLEGICQDIVERITEYLNPNHPRNPFASDFTRSRNYLLWLLMVSSGARRGEVWDAKVGDITYAMRRFTITKSKATPRVVPVSADAADAFDSFISHHWSRLPKEARRRGFLFTDVTGRKLVPRSVTDIFHHIRETVPGAPGWLTSHTLRRSWNDRFSEMTDAMPPDMRMAKEEETRVHNRLQGWSSTSEMGAKYARRHIRKKADELGQALAEKIAFGMGELSDG